MYLESGMLFDEGNSYRIEESGAYKAVSGYMRVVDFLQITTKSILFIEAKTTFPNPKNADSVERFREQIFRIYEKFLHSFNLLLALKTGCLSVTNFNIPSAYLGFEEKPVIFVLVIRNHEEVWCDAVRLALLEVIPKYIIRLWKVRVIVLSSRGALNKGLVVGLG